jgi:hypothetical protein
VPFPISSQVALDLDANQLGMRDRRGNQPPGVLHISTIPPPKPARKNQRQHQPDFELFHENQFAANSH